MVERMIANNNPDMHMLNQLDKAGKIPLSRRNFLKGAGLFGTLLAGSRVRAVENNVETSTHPELVPVSEFLAEYTNPLTEAELSELPGLPENHVNCAVVSLKTESGEQGPIVAFNPEESDSTFNYTCIFDAETGEWKDLIAEEAEQLSIAKNAVEMATGVKVITAVSGRLFDGTYFNTMSTDENTINPFKINSNPDTFAADFYDLRTLHVNGIIHKAYYTSEMSYALSTNQRKAAAYNREPSPEISPWEELLSTGVYQTEEMSIDGVKYTPGQSTTMVLRNSLSGNTAFLIENGLYEFTGIYFTSKNLTGESLPNTFFIHPNSEDGNFAVGADILPDMVPVKAAQQGLDAFSVAQHFDSQTRTLPQSVSATGRLKMNNNGQTREQRMNDNPPEHFASFSMVGFSSQPDQDPEAYLPFVLSSSTEVVQAG